MKIAVINFSGNVGKSTIARHLLLPRLPGAALVNVESLNATEGDRAGAGPGAAGTAQALRGRQFAELQEFLQTVDSAVVDIGASNVEELMTRMGRFSGSQEDFDCFVVPTVPALKQQKDTIATLADLANLGVQPHRLKVVLNMVEAPAEIGQTFDTVLDYLAVHPIAQADPACYVGNNELYGRIRGSGQTVQDIAGDMTDYKALIARARSTEDRLVLAQKLGTVRLARGVLPELDACFKALRLEVGQSAQLALH